MPDKLTPFGDALSGAAGAVIANTLVFPLDVIKTRLQVQSKAVAKLNPNQQYASAADAFFKILKSEGIQGLYSGKAFLSLSFLSPLLSLSVLSFFSSLYLSSLLLFLI
jgi:hypothetical protein